MKLKKKVEVRRENFGVCWEKKFQRMYVKV